MKTIHLAPRLKRHLRIRRRTVGTPERLRLCVFRSNRHIAAQLVDDLKGHTVMSVSTVSKEFRKTKQSGAGVPAAQWVGRTLAQAAHSEKIEQIVFDRAGYRYHGRVKALADAAREGGLKF